MRMAGYSKISATAFMTKQVTIDKNEAKGKPIFEPVSNTDRKIYIPTYINRFRMVGCVDSGSDLTILHYSYYKRIYKNSAKLLKSDITHITTFCDTALPIKGKIYGLICLAKNHPGIRIPIYIVQDIPNVPAFLLGNNLLKAGLGLIAYSGSIIDPQPEVIFNHPIYYECSVYY